MGIVLCMTMAARFTMSDLVSAGHFHFGDQIWRTGQSGKN